MNRCIPIPSVVCLLAGCTARAVAQPSAPTNAWVYTIAEEVCHFP